MPYCTVLSTVPSKAEGVKLLRLLLKKKLVACGNLVGGVESHFWWKGKIDSASETLLLLKTESSRAAKVLKAIKESHPYEVPEILVLPVLKGSPSYLKWISDSLK